MRQVMYLAVVVVGVLVLGAYKLGTHTRDWRDGLPAAPVGIVTGVSVSVSPSTAVTTLLLADQTKLGKDIRAVGDADRRVTVAVEDTRILIADLQSSEVTAATRKEQLRQALSVARSGTCAPCASMLSAAAAH